MTDYLQHLIDYQRTEVVQVIDEVMLWSARFGLLLLDHLKPTKGLHILDVGCGTGFPLFELAQRYGDTCQVVGVDPWAEAMKRAAIKQEIYGVGNVRLITCDAANVPLPDATFELITSNLGINNFDDPMAVLHECYRLAKPGASLVLTTNVKGHFAEFYAIYRDILNEMGKSDAVERLNQQEDHRRDRERVCSMLENARFRVTNTVEDQFTIRFADGSAMLRHWLIRLGFLEGWRIVDAADEVAVFTRLEERLNQVAAEMGELRLTVPMLLVEAQKSS
jgi:arsenite methyltransferase